MVQEVEENSRILGLVWGKSGGRKKGEKGEVQAELGWKIR